jgi:hypothetical protein
MTTFFVQLVSLTNGDKITGYHKTRIRFAVDVPHLPLLLKDGRVRRVSEGFAVVHPMVSHLEVGRLRANWLRKENWLGKAQRRVPANSNRLRDLFGRPAAAGRKKAVTPQIPPTRLRKRRTQAPRPALDSLN